MQVVKGRVMARQPKTKAFHSPFAKLKAHTEHLAQKQADIAAHKLAEQQKAAQAQRQAHQVLDDAETFLRAVSGAVPLRPSVQREPPDPTVERVRISEDELVMAELTGLVSGHGTFRVNESEEMLFGLAPGVNVLLLEQLQQGHFAYRRHIDLHGLQRDEAHLAVNRFVASARRDAERCVLIITGRGKKSPGGMPVLRTSLPRWLSRAPNRPHVLAFCTAQSVDGGSGAFYVLLRRPGIKPYGEIAL